MGGDAVDEFQDDDRLAHPGAAEQADLASFDVGSQQIDDLDPGLQDLGAGLQLLELGGRPVDGPPLHIGRQGLTLVDGFTQEVEQATERGLSDGDGDRLLRIDDLHASSKTVGGIHGHGPHFVVSEMLLDLGDQVHATRRGVEIYFERVVDRREHLGELHVDHRPDDLYDLAFVHRLACPFLSGQGVGACHHFQDLLGDGRLSGPVHG